MKRRKALALAATGAFISGISLGFLLLVIAPQIYMVTAISRLLMVVAFGGSLILIFAYPFETLALIVLLLRAAGKWVYRNLKSLSREEVKKHERD